LQLNFVCRLFGTYFGIPVACTTRHDAIILDICVWMEQRPSPWYVLIPSYNC